MGLLLAYFFQIYLWEHIYWNWLDIYRALIASFFLFVLFVIFYHLPYNFAREIRAKLEKALGSLFVDFGVLKIFLVALAAGIGEELLFRGLFTEGAYAVLSTLGGSVTF